MENKMNRNSIQVFEHSNLRIEDKIGECIFDKRLNELLVKHYGTNGVPYYSLIRNGVKFNQYVGVIQVGSKIIEVLPKIDKNDNKTEKWQKILIDMLRTVGFFKITSTSESTLRIKPNSILDLYFEYFINEVNYLIHRGLIKKYRKTEGNSFALKGSLHFPKHIRENLVHQERFYVRYQTYDNEHIFHKILYKTIKLLKCINTNPLLSDNIAELLLFFPEMPDLKITEKTFDTLIYNHKTECYRKAIDIARLILLNYHPDIITGRNNVLAIMFDMNRLWEKFVYVSLRKHLSTNKNNYTIKPQYKKDFWTLKNRSPQYIKPDIFIKNEKDNKSFIFDTKWKLSDKKPSSGDLQQMFAYSKYYNAKKVALIYPSTDKDFLEGYFIKPDTNREKDTECSIIPILLNEKVKEWQGDICNQIRKILNCDNLRQ